MKQMYDFIPVYVACGGSELDGMDYMLARKVLKKFESQNGQLCPRRDQGSDCLYGQNFGESHMKDSRGYLQRIQNLY